MINVASGTVTDIIAAGGGPYGVSISSEGFGNLVSDQLIEIRGAQGQSPRM